MKRTICMVVCILFMVVLMTGFALSGEMKTAEQVQKVMITGTINNDNQLVDNDGQIFDIADTKEGKELLTHTGQKVQVKGTVMEDKWKKQISISAYEIIKE